MAEEWIEPLFKFPPGTKWRLQFRWYDRMLSDGSWFTIHYWWPDV